ncbi:coiled-coil domain-containing protein 18 [Crotalus tigris]|uniref:coiled-coil domain-containing protein 18 n=1 Tax=Crotalus tigris TaxID=88082 RepID=UPI00192F5EBA|nr:coiled-coil domain-containing protein 18 [Crotalus tigris]XP_039204451.1 coiled-coil domain-containing protein 18 [Crotalus tigris]XP_039204452.1 coiled-coil domain-containing protein 18 [Crotalus tigris]XP_039204453.1 coiled-coil domain-containing protein 18 [Crotalus tigris]XP_039204454.1 coiled-coil domain-containing protein 18 [Crotalus tigris]XP_039204455.1 coiled-coil domain-containing protein 18 [Crotalus tigris]XP_039204456.1 coiled-coil domain-containing protein 18 [Crotalus tigri
MEPNLWDSSDQQEHVEDLLANIVALRGHLKKTEKNLQDLGEQLYSNNSHNSELGIHDSELEILTLEDLVDPSELQNNTVSKMSWHNSDSSRKPRSKSYSLAFDKSMEEENELLRDKLNVVRENNASLISQNHKLMNEIETIKFELNQARAQISFLESTLGTRSVHIPILEEQLASLEADVHAQDSLLKDTEDKLEESQKMLMEKEYDLQKLKEDYRIMKHDLIGRTKQGKRTEQQRNEALYNAEELTRTFKQYKEKITNKLEKVQVEEQILEKKLMNCVNEKEKLLTQCNAYKSELENIKDQLRQLTEENCIGTQNLKSMEAKLSEMEFLLKHTQQKNQILENKLQEQKTTLEEKSAIINENEDLKGLIVQQKDQLNLYCQEIQRSKIELKTLENVIFQLTQSSSKEANHSNEMCSNWSETDSLLKEELRQKINFQEAGIQKLQTEYMACKLGQVFSDDDEGQKLNGLEIEPVKLSGNQTGTKCEQLELISKQFEKEKQILIKKLEELRIKLEKSEEENAVLKNNIAQRTNQFQTIQEELLEKAAKSCRLEREVARKSSQFSILEKQLEEKTFAYVAALARNTELEQELMVMNSQLQSMERNIIEEQEHFSAMLEETKLINHEQQKEMERQIDLLQSELETKNQQFLEQEKTMSIFQQDVLYKQHHLESLDRLLIESKEEMEKQKIKKDEALKKLQGQFADETVKVKQLQKALESCKQDIALYLDHLEEEKVLFEKQLEKKSEEIQRLQKEIKHKNDSLQSTSEQNLALQQSLQQQQQMLHQETIRNSELDDSQIKLQQQVSKLEQALQKQKDMLEEELRRTNERLHLATEENNVKRQKIGELTATIRQIKQEMDQCKDELIDMEKELVHLRRDGHSKAMQVSQLEITLQQRTSEFNKKTHQVKELEDKLLISETQQNDSIQKIESLETDLKNTTGELKTTLRQLQDFRDTLQNAQISLQEKCTTIHDLTDELRECKDELEEKKEELLDMEKVLKERNWDLKQRAAQVTQLDMSIREYRGEMEQKIISLQGSLEKAELQIKDYNKQIESLASKVQCSKEELQEKEFNILQQHQDINHLRKENEQKQQRITDTEKNLKDQESCIAEQYKEILDLGQQLRLEREAMKQVHVDLLESRRQQAQAQRDVDRLSLELEEVNHISHEKETRINNLAEQLGAAQVRETELEARMQAEIKTLTAEIHLLKQSSLSEKISHEEEQAKWQQSLSKSHHVNGQLQQIKMELDDAQDTVYNLQQQLQSRDDAIQAANEKLLLKESELTRLQTRIAAHERTGSIKQLIEHHWFDDQELGFAKHSTRRKLWRSTSTSNLNIKGNENLLSQNQTVTLHSSVSSEMSKNISHASPKSLNESSFDPLTYGIDEEVPCSSNDFQTLSGMLKYISKEIKDSENSSL